MPSHPSHDAARQALGVDVFASSDLLEVASRAADRWASLRSANIEQYGTQLRHLHRHRSSKVSEGPTVLVVEASARNLVQFVRNGATVKHAAKRIAESVPVSKTLAEWVVGDGILFVNASVTRARQEAMGVKSYTWRAIDDGREDPEHVLRDGSVYKWADGAPRGGHPGEDVGCRCTAEPVLPSWEEPEQRSLAQPAAEKPTGGFLKAFLREFLGKR